MRNTFIRVLTDLAAQDERIVLLTGDLGFMLMEPFMARFPERFINVGVAEQDLVGIATGLAEAGMIPYIYSITPFAVLRPYEFIRNGPVYHRFQVRILGGGAGFEYPHDGISHFGIDDIGVLRVQPGISIFTPADFQQAETIFRTTWDMPGPIYYRLGKDEKNTVQGLSGRFSVGAAELVGDGNDLLIISMGAISVEAAHAVLQLKASGISCTQMIVSSINPPPLKTMLQVLPHFKSAITVEAHYKTGGLGSLVAEVIAENQIETRLYRSAIDKMPDGRIGTQDYLYNIYGLSSKALVEKAAAILNKPSK